MLAIVQLAAGQQRQYAAMGAGNSSCGTWTADKEYPASAHGDKSWIPADSKLIVPTQVISKTNVAEFTAKMKDLLKK